MVSFMYSLVDKLFFMALILICVSSCSAQRKEYHHSSSHLKQAGCSIPKESIDGKVQLENGIREQVKFLGEPEMFSTITHRMSEYKIPAVSLTVIKQGKIDWTDIYHNADFSAESSLDCNSLFQAASLSKPVTFLATVRMQAAGKIDLDKNIQSYLKDFVLPNGKQTADNPVTLRNIFSHTSGITPGGYQGYLSSLTLPSDIDILVGRGEANTPAIAVVAPPNEILAYSGGAYTLAEVALQDRFNDEFARIMQKWILDPVGMKHSDFTQPLLATKHKQLAKGYTHSGKVLEGGWRNHPEQAAAGLWSNSADMAKFLIEIYKAYQGGRSIFSQADIKSLISDERDGDIYGFRVDRLGDDIAITHYGGNAGYRTGMTINLATGDGLVYLINSDNGGELGDALLLSAAQVYNWKSFKQTIVYRKHLDGDVLRALSGSYKWNNQIDLSIRFDEISNRLSLFFPNGDEYKLTPIVGDQLEFIHSKSGINVNFSNKGSVQSFYLYGKLAEKQH
jgi:CubicO group peptidase (beta-lactamase class C family)